MNAARLTAAPRPARRFTPWGLAVGAILWLSGCVMAPLTPMPPGAPMYRVPPPMNPVVVAPAPTSPAPMYFYPERSQPEAAQERDRYECYRWAARETGTDPGMTPVRQPYVVMPSPAPMPPSRDGASVVGGAATGAVMGAALSSPRHAGSNMVLGAVFGALLGAATQESRAQAIEQAQARQQAQQAAVQAAQQAAQQRPLDHFRRAMSACMGGRGYRIG